MTALIALVSCLIVIGLGTYRYEKKLERVHEANTQTILHNFQLIASSEKLLADYMTLVNVMKDHFTEEEIQKMFEEKRKELEKARREQSQ